MPPSKNLLHHPFGEVFPCYSPMFNKVVFRWSHNKYKIYLSLFWFFSSIFFNCLNISLIVFLQLKHLNNTSVSSYHLIIIHPLGYIRYLATYQQAFYVFMSNGTIHNVFPYLQTIIINLLKLIHVCLIIYIDT